MSGFYAGFVLSAHSTRHATPAQFADAAEGVYWHSHGLAWQANETHIWFSGSSRSPIPMARLYYLAGVR